jgi:hypothetical protein
MSKATNNSLATMTQRAVNTAKYAALPRVVNVIVMEQANAEYSNATTVLSPGVFNYNAFANHGAKLGQAPYIVIANNDLEFRDGWLDRMLAANWPVTSPVSPGYHRHHNVMGNEIGQQVGRHLAGWCYMLTRELWSELGGLDDTYPFWCADNAVMKQLQDKGIHPMLVAGATVHHKVSATLMRESRDVQDELTWGLVHQYNLDTNANIFARDYRYDAWKRRNRIQETP